MSCMQASSIRMTIEQIVTNTKFHLLFSATLNRRNVFNDNNTNNNSDEIFNTLFQNILNTNVTPVQNSNSNENQTTNNDNNNDDDNTNNSPNAFSYTYFS